MSVFVNAYIQHSLTPAEIIKLPDALRSIPDQTLAGQWHWTAPIMNTLILADMWTRKVEYFMNNPWSGQDLPLLEKDQFTLYFDKPHLVTFDSFLTWGAYRNDIQLRKEFNHLAKTMSTLLNAVDILLVPDPGTVDFIDEVADLTVDAYRQRANGNKMYAMELD